MEGGAWRARQGGGSGKSREGMEGEKKGTAGMGGEKKDEAKSAV